VRRVIRRRSSQQKGKDTRRDPDGPAPFFNFTDDSAPAEEAPLFNLEEVHERRILSWSPEPDEDDPSSESEPAAAEHEEPARSAHELPVAPEQRPAPAPQAALLASPPPQPQVERVVTPPAPQVVSRPPAPVARPTVAPPAAPLREVAPPSPPAAVEVEFEPEADETAPVERTASKRRGRPRGRPRRQVHFHVDPDEERLLMAGVERYGSQQKALIAALESLQEADVLRAEIERLRAESARHRRLLDEAGALFNR
jgi:uncharacterized small protein (DUF1192 family)